MNLCLWTRCADPKRIPYYTTLPYGCLWKECTITVVAWEYVGDVPPDDDLPPPQDNAKRYGSRLEDSEYFVRKSMILFRDAIRTAQPPQSPSTGSSAASNPTDGITPIHNNGDSHSNTTPKS